MELKTVATLERERERLRKSLAVIDEAIKAARQVDRIVAALEPRHTPKRKRVLTEAGRKAISAAQKARHAQAPAAPHETPTQRKHRQDDEVEDRLNQAKSEGLGAVEAEA